MADQNHTHGAVRPRTAVLTRGFDPALSVGSARPAVFRSSTYVFPSPEEAEHAVAITTGKIQMEDGGRADLIYSRFSHPNAEILEDQIVPLDAGGRYAAVARRPAEHGSAAHEPAEQECAAHRRSAARAQAAEPGDLSDAVHGSRTEAHFREAVRFSGRHVLLAG